VHYQVREQAAADAAANALEPSEAVTSAQRERE
jgi:hypothetical protein